MIPGWFPSLGINIEDLDDTTLVELITIETEKRDAKSDLPEDDCGIIAT